MSGALFLSLPYLAIAVPISEGTVSALTPERDTRIQIALVIAFVAVCLVAWILRPDSPPDRRTPDANKFAIRPSRVTRR